MTSIRLKQGGTSFAAGFIFAMGLALSGMTRPEKIIGFLNPSQWDPSLVFVMVGALGVHLLTYRMVRRRATPLLDTKWHVPNRKDLTARLFLGSAIFGMGWGLGGFCPGPGVTSLAFGDPRALIFVGAMLVGMILFKRTERYLPFKE